MAGEEFPGGLSPFRAGFLKVQLFIGGAWVDILTTELGDDGVTIVRGRGADARQGEPSSVRFRVKDPTGKWNNRHPGSVYFGLIGRGTPLRVQVQYEAGGTVFDRWYGEVVTWQPRWTKTGAADAYVEVEGAGAMRRLGRGSSPLRSPLYRAISTIGTDLVAYWPLEDGEASSQLQAAVGGRPITVQGAPQLAAYSGFAASSPMPTLQDGRLLAVPPTYTPTGPATAQVRWLMRVPSGTTPGVVLLRAKASGTLGWVEIRHGGGTSLQVEGFNDAGVSVGSAVWGFGTVEGRKLRVSLELTQSGANISVTVTTYEVGAAAGIFNTGSFAGVTLGSITQLDVNPTQAALGDVAFGHLSLERVITSLFAVSSSVLVGYAGERADDRMVRLCAENGVSFALLPPTTPAQLMGAQSTGDLLTLLRECEATDGGMLYEPVSATELGYRTGASLLSQTPVVVPYQDNLLLPFEPVEDDEGTRNVVTVTRAGGSSSTVTETSGPLGTAAVGVYDDEVTLSLASDADTEQQAGWLVHLGTTDEARWPLIGIDLAHPVLLANRALRDAVLAVTLGVRLDVTNVPDWVPPFEVSQLTQGYTETITPHHHRLWWNCSPARPYRVARWSTAGDRWSGAGTELAGALSTTTQTTFTVTPPAGVGWTHDDGDYPIVIGGEVMTVTDVVGGTDFTVVRGVNGVRKTHLAGAAVALADPVYYGL